MGRLRFVQPALVRLPLSDGDWIDIQAELTAGQERDMLASMARVFEAGAGPHIDPSRVQVATVVGYLQAWSFVDAAGAPVAVSADAIRALEIESFNEILAAITAHEAAHAAKKAATRAPGTGS